MDFYAINSRSLNEEAKLLTHVLHRHYETLELEVIKNVTNLKRRITKSLQDYMQRVILPQLEDQRHNHVMLLIGSDFSFVTRPLREG
jgi:hypothetical protein